MGDEETKETEDELAAETVYAKVVGSSSTEKSASETSAPTDETMTKQVESD